MIDLFNVYSVLIYGSYFHFIDTGKYMSQRYSYVHIQYNTNFKVMATKMLTLVQVEKSSNPERPSNDATGPSLT